MTVAGWVGTISLVAVVALGALATVRDKVVEGGWDSPRWLMRWLQRTAQRAAARRVMRDSAMLGSEFFEHHGNAIDVAYARTRVPAGVRDRPDRRLLEELRRWTIRLSGDADFRGSQFYVNTMGAVCNSEADEASFAAIMHAWIRKLQAANAIQPFDCLLALKEGNPILIHAVARRLTRSENRSIRPVFCKGPLDPARVSQGPHETDFEGLRAIRDEQPLARASDGRYRALAIDDNCTSGRSLRTAIEAFNQFVTANSEDYPFVRVDTAVVLFLVKKDQPVVLGPDITLHALLALGEPEMKRIRGKTPISLRQANGFKQHEACEFSKTLGQRWSGGAEAASTGR